MRITSTGPAKTFAILLISIPLLGSMRGCVKVKPPAPSSQSQAPGWFRGDLHYHTTFSDDARRQMGDDLPTSIELAEWAGLDFVAVTDHRTDIHFLDPAFVSNKLVLLPGEEWGSSSHAGAIGIGRQVPEVDRRRGNATLNGQMQQAIDDTHAQGGVFILNHPCSKGKLWLWDVKGFDAVEVWNLPWTFKNPDTDPQSLADKLNSLGPNFPSNPWIAKGLAHRGGGSNHQALKFWEAMLDDGVKVAAVGGGDRHMAFVPGHPSTYVLADTYDRQGILDGIRKGRTWVGRGPDGARVRFQADGDGDGTFESEIGDTLPLGQPIDFEVEVTGGAGGFVEVISGGRTLHHIAVTSDPFVFRFRETPTTYAWYRIDVFEILKNQLPHGQAFTDIVKNDPTNLVAGLLNLILFAQNHGLTFSTVTTTLPTVVFEDDYDRILNLSTRHVGYCRGALTSPIYAGSR